MCYRSEKLGCWLFTWWIYFEKLGYWLFTWWSFPSVSMDFTLETDREFLEGIWFLANRINLLVDEIMVLLSLWVQSVYFKYKDIFYKQRKGLISSLYLALANIFIDWFENMLFWKINNLPEVCLRYVDDTFVIYQYGRYNLDQFISSLSIVQILYLQWKWKKIKSYRSWLY